MSTTGKGFHYPVYTDTPDVPRDLQQLAADVDAYLDAHPGPQGPAGTIEIGTVTTVSSSTPAEVHNVGTTSAAILNLVLPRGIDGIVGGPGPSNILSIGTVTDGGSAAATITGSSPAQVLNLVLPQGPAGPTGAQGPAGPTTLAVGTTTTGTAGTNASVVNTGTNTAAVFSFTIPRGATGATGATGPQGPAGSSAVLDPIGTTISLDPAPATYTKGVTSAWYPLSSNAYTLGLPASTGVAARYWSAVWSNTGVIQPSDSRFKTNIEPTDLGLNFINSLNPVKYKFIEGQKELVDGEYVSVPGERTHYGLISQEVKQTLDNFGTDDFGGWILTNKLDSDSQQALRYDEFISPLIKAIQELTARIQALEAK